MGDNFSINEIVEMAVQIERNGKTFYETLASQTEYQRVDDIFSFLAREETFHLDAFLKLLKAIEKYEPNEAYTEDYFSYMQSLARTHIFTQKDKGAEYANNVKSVDEALDLGIKFEKDSIVFFDEMKKIIPKDDHEIIDVIIAQEQDHLKKLTAIKENL